MIVEQNHEEHQIKINERRSNTTTTVEQENIQKDDSERGNAVNHLCGRLFKAFVIFNVIANDSPNCRRLEKQTLEK